MKIEDVTRWIVWCGIGHAVQAIGDGWAHTACCSMISADMSSTTTERPRRICSRCRMAIVDCRPLDADLRKAGVRK